MARARQARSAASALRRLFAGLAGGIAFVFAAALTTAPANEAQHRIVIAAGTVLALVAFAALLAHRAFAAPLDRLARDLAMAARDDPHRPVSGAARRWLDGAGRVTSAAADVQARLSHAESSVATQLAAATARLDEQNRRLEGILLDLSEGVVVCGLDHQVLLYNQLAANLVDEPHALGLGRPIFGVLSREPILHHLDRLLHQSGQAGVQPTAPGTVRFICASAGSGLPRRARMGLLNRADGTPSGYVLTLADADVDMDETARRDRMVRTAIEHQRGMLGSLRAAAETLVGAVDLAPAERQSFENVILEESVRLSEQNAALTQALDQMGARFWAMAEIHTGDLIAFLRRRLDVGRPIEVVPAGMPDWLFVDSLALTDLLEHLARALAHERSVETLTIAVARRDRVVDLDLIWSGAPIRAAELDEWLDQPFERSKGTLDGRAVLERHGSDCWSLSGRAGEGLIRIPLPPAAQPPSPDRRDRPPRPEFYDFDLLGIPAPEALRGRPLRSLSYVVFDIETTGLNLSGGDVPVSIGAVRVVNGRVLPMENFERLVNPGRTIPPDSIRFHGITDAMVEGKPPLPLVLPQFERFVGDSVLVAHNAAFDMLALTRGAAGCGLSFDHPIVDTLLISAWLDPEEADHSLEGLAARLGLQVAVRHHALNDAMLAAAILVRQFDQLESRGVERFGQLVAETDMTARLRANQMQF